MNRMNLVILLDRLDQMIESATEIPLMGKSLIDAEEALDLIDKIKAALPEEVKRAEWLASEKERMIEESKSEAEKLVIEAEEYVGKLVSESEIAKRARDEADRMLADAREQVKQMREDAEQYAGDVLKNLETALTQTMTVVRQGQQTLRVEESA